LILILILILILVWFLPLGGAAVYGCDNDRILIAALPFAEKLAFRIRASL
jgi:hypothetical protein